VVANAIRHTPAGGIVDVAVGPATADDDAGTAAVVRVRDECGGIPESDVPRLFDVGFRGEPARTPQAEPVSRAGLGLAITRGIVEAHNGSVDVQNVHGGCEFTVRLLVAA
jgi:signal transduction histidine kinase